VSDAVQVEALDAAGFHAAIPGLAAVLVDSVEGGASVNFMAPLTTAEAVGWWEGIREAVEDGSTTVFAARIGDRIVGCVLLIRSVNPNSPHRAEIGKVLVLRDARRRGIGSALMAAAESRARADGRWLLILDTMTDSEGDALYRSMGWVCFGVVPDYAYFPDGSLGPTSFFWKDLR
jgi:GNAT superfamily N-acetyltransferase